MRIENVDMPGAIGRQGRLPLVTGRQAHALLRRELRRSRPGQTGNRQHHDYEFGKDGAHRAGQGETAFNIELYREATPGSTPDLARRE